MLVGSKKRVNFETV